MNVEVRKCREHIFETRMTEGITIQIIILPDPFDLWIYLF